MRPTRPRDAGAGLGDLTTLERREFVVALLGAAAGLLLLPLRALAGDLEAKASAPLSADQIEVLRSSPYVYVSPLLRDGRESRCHAEVWFSWIDGRVVMTVSSEGWKARSIDRGLDRAQLWAGDYGRVKGPGASAEAFRQSPSFRARAEKLQNPALLEKLLKDYERKYPAEISKWRDRMRAGHAEGSRVLIRYAPEPI